MWEADRHAKKELKKRVRGVRPLERQVEQRNDGRAPLDASGLKLRERLSAIQGSLERVAQKGGRCVSP